MHHNDVIAIHQCGYGYQWFQLLVQNIFQNFGMVVAWKVISIGRNKHLNDF